MINLNPILAMYWDPLWGGRKEEEEKQKGEEVRRSIRRCSRRRIPLLGSAYRMFQLRIYAENTMCFCLRPFFDAIIKCPTMSNYREQKFTNLILEVMKSERMEMASCFIIPWQRTDGQEQKRSHDSFGYQPILRQILTSQSLLNTFSLMAIKLRWTLDKTLKTAVSRINIKK